ncbi:fatty-acid oxidation protein subunit alpha [Psychromonas sp. psych-6C06]|uniref:3-hydroxyacyl-CoA dehydrogenase NAD-binding domain-containing protein n=1 Tax=Psychromonas sp. psych-6C06 TaxID=2058089 RepID=UPI000C31D8DA|nr:3-hydroxyacyl-CoA dehydrogenase NAD-binding domain-containing protein [Psychromonas sp. psych-6C06]PKF60582.1 fatty-acid oxidation protein subunit alpha [Psychromonas sp. psych-6C06]
MNFDLSINNSGVATLLFDFKNEKVNKLDGNTLLELKDHLATLSRDNSIKLLVFKSAKAAVFIAGADINEIKDIRSKEEAYQKAGIGQKILHQISQLPFPSLAVINGACVGGGCELALACTYRIISDDKKAVIGLPEVSLGIIPGFGGCVRLPKLIGLQAALQMILSAKVVVAKKALRLKLVDAIYNHTLAEQSVNDFIAQLLADKTLPKKLLKQRNKTLSQKLLEDNPLGRKLIFKKAFQNLQQKTKGFYPAPFKALQVIETIVDLSIEDALEEELHGFSEVAVTDISKNLIQLFFTNEALKKESGISDTTITPQQINNGAVIGAGVMGGGIAWLFSNNNKNVRLKDIQWDAVAKGYQTANLYYQQMNKRRKIKPNQIRYQMNHIAGTVNYNGFKQLDIAIEAVVENMDIKKSVLAEAESQLPKNAILASNTSSLSITEMASDLKRPENMIGMHFFNPVNRMPLVEIIPGKQTSPQTIASTVKLAKQLGKTPIVVGDCAGFLVNRILIPMLNEAALILQEGGNVTEIDHCLEAFGLPMGPFVLADEVGIDIGFHVASILEQAYGERMQVAGLFKHIYVEEKLLGKKSGAGFYKHPIKSPRRYNKNIDTILTFYRAEHHIKLNTFDNELMIDRCILIMVNEAIRCLEEGVIENPAYLDMAMLMGTGFPAFRGGLLKYADNQGLQTVCDKLMQLSDQYGSRFAPAALLIEKAKNGQTFYEGEKHE